MTRGILERLNRLAPRTPGDEDPPHLTSIHATFRDHTMLSQYGFVTNLMLAERVRGIDGAIVECGVWKGGMIAGIAALLGPPRQYLLFDSFEGLPPAKAIDGPAALAWQADTASAGYFDNCAAPIEEARRAMQMAGVADAVLVAGWFADTLPALSGSTDRLSIALLRLDADWYDATILCLATFFDRVVPGGLIVIDDYYAWDGCSRAVHDFLSQRAAAERLREHRGVCYIVKQ